MAQFGSSSNIEKDFIKFVNAHPEGVTVEQVKSVFKKRNWHQSIPALQRSGEIRIINEYGEDLNFNHFRNRGTFKYYPK